MGVFPVHSHLPFSRQHLSGIISQDSLQIKKRPDDLHHRAAKIQAIGITSKLN